MEKKIFLTGGTGTLGIELVKEFAVNEISLHLLIRASDEVHLKNRFERILKFHELQEYRDSIFYYIGDVTKPKLGMDKKDYDFLTKTVTHVVHCAGKVKLNQTREEAILLSKESTQNIIEFCDDIRQNGNLQKIDITTTVGVGGKTTRNLPESFLTKMPKFHNNYEYGKYCTEEYLSKLIDDGYPITVHRPSMVVGNSETGKTLNFQVFYHLCDFLSGIKTKGVMPELGTRSLDVIPVDIAAKMMFRIILDSDYIGKVVNICSGKKNEIDLRKLKKMVRHIYSDHGIKLPSNKIIPLNLVKYAFSTDFPLKRISHALPAVVTSSKEYSEIGKVAKALKYLNEYLVTDQHFINKETVQGLKGFVEIPNSETYLPQIISYYLREKMTSVPEKMVSDISREVRIIEAFRDYVWPIYRKKVSDLLTPRCEKCMISANLSPLKDGICQDCQNFVPTQENRKEVEKYTYKMNKEILKKIESNTSEYDAVVLFSGGKDSTYLVDRLLKDFPQIKILALSVDNSFMAPAAKENIDWVIKKLNVDLQIIRPPQDMMIRMYRYAFTHLNERGCSGTVDQFDGDIIHDIARNYAAKNKIPLVFSGVSQTQVENIFGLKSYKLPSQEAKKTREQVAGITLTKIFSQEELVKYWWNGANHSSKNHPQMFFPFYAWRPSEVEVKRFVVRKKLVPPGNQSPLMTNNQLIVLMGIVDFSKYGYSSFEKEFSKNVREGWSDYDTWRNTFEIVEYMSKTGRLLDKSFYNTINKLGLKKSSLGISHL